MTGFGPVPALLSSGGLISFRLVVFHFLRRHIWVFSAPASTSFWAREAPTIASELTLGTPLQLESPATYLFRYSSPLYNIATCYSPIDLTDCYADDADDTTLVYCVYTLADSLRNPDVRAGRIFHNLGIDRIAYNRLAPIAVAGPKAYRACPGAPAPQAHLDGVISAVSVRDRLEFSGLVFMGGAATNFTDWPPALPLLLSPFHVEPTGSLQLTNCTVRVESVAATVAALRALPAAPVAVDPARPNLQPSVDAWPAAGTEQPFTITEWTLSKNAWLSYAVQNVYDFFSTPSAAKWAFDRVRVEAQDMALTRADCFEAGLMQGVVTVPGIARVADDAQLRQALAAGKRYIQVVADIRLDPARWPSGSGALLVEAGIIEVRACHPAPGSRYTLDLAGLHGVLRSTGRLILQGDLRVTGLGWEDISREAAARLAAGTADCSLLPAFVTSPNRVGGNGTIELENLLVEGVLAPEGPSPSPGLRRSELLAALRLGSLGQVARTLNVTLRDTRAVLGVWALVAAADQAGTWAFSNTNLVWLYSAAAPSSGGAGAAKAAAIAVPVAVGGLALVAAIVGLWVYCRRRRARDAGGGPGSAFGLHGQSPRKRDSESTVTSDAPAHLGKAGGSGPCPGSSGASSGGTGGGCPSAAGAKAAAMLPSCGAEGEADADAEGAFPVTTTTATGTSTGTGTGGPDSRTRAGLPSPLLGIDAAKRALEAGRPAQGPGPGCPWSSDELTLLGLLGAGSYGRVYRGAWRGSPVAVKVIHLPGTMGGRERHERMAVMEAAISSSLSHPNIVQTYTYSVESVEGAQARGAARRAMMMGSGPGPSTDSTLPEASGGAGQGGGTEGADGGGSADVVSWEIRLVQEYCECGSLRDRLDAGAFVRRRAQPGSNRAAQPHHASLPQEAPASPREGAGPGARSPPRASAEERRTSVGARGSCGSRAGGEAGEGGEGGEVEVALDGVLETAIDIARAMAHLHRQGIVHADLKPRNVLLKGSTTDPRGFVAKVADFGLSMRLDAHETHVSNAFQGTLAYMAPETLLAGRVSPASDVYAFGILLWELFTGGSAFEGTPRALLGHAISKEAARPAFPAAPAAPFEYQLLACRCWESNPEIRPEFESILEELKRMRARLGGRGGRSGRESAGAAPGDLWGLPQAPPASQQDIPFVPRAAGTSGAAPQPPPGYHGGGGGLYGYAPYSGHSGDNTCEEELEDGELDAHGDGDGSGSDMAPSSAALEAAAGQGHGDGQVQQRGVSGGGQQWQGGQGRLAGYGEELLEGEEPSTGRSL